MRTKPIWIAVAVLALLAAALAVAMFVVGQRESSTPPDTVEAPVEMETADDAGAVRPDEALLAEPLPEAAGSPEGLYGDLDAALQAVREKPEVEIEQVPAPLSPPTRADDDDEDEAAPDPA